MRRIALINQKGGVGKTTSTVNLGAALARLGRRVVLIDLDPQANLSLHLDCILRAGEPSIYTVLLGSTPLAQAVRPTSTPGLWLVGSNIDLSGAELELASAMGRESLLRDAVDTWEEEARARTGAAPADYLLIDCPPSLGLLSVNGLVAARETVITLQTEFFALQGMSKLIDVVQLLRRRLNPSLAVTGILPCLYDNRLRLAREVLGEIRKYFPGEVFRRPIAKNIKLAEAPSYGRTIFEYAPESSGAADYAALAMEVVDQESRDAELARLPRPSAVPTRPPRSSALRTVALTPSSAAEGDTAEDSAAEEGLENGEGEPAEAAPAERDRTLRAHELPPLPLDAFEIRQA
jgi:chromosome partitioning protein